MLAVTQWLFLASTGPLPSTFKASSGGRSSLSHVSNLSFLPSHFSLQPGLLLASGFLRLDRAHLDPLPVSAFPTLITSSKCVRPGHPAVPSSTCHRWPPVSHVMEKESPWVFSDALHLALFRWLAFWSELAGYMGC